MPAIRSRKRGLATEPPTWASETSPSNHCPLLELPAELLAEIVEYLATDNSALSSLALTNSECRQLARVQQFAEICLTYSERSMSLLMKIKDEAEQARPPSRHLPMIAAYVQRVTVRSNRELVEACGSLQSDGSQGDDDATDVAHGRHHYGQMYQLYRAVIMSLGVTVLHNVRSLSWCDAYAVDEAFMDQVVTWPIQHLRLDSFAIEHLSPTQLSHPPSSWPLRSLHLDLRLPRHNGEMQDVDPTGIINGILHSCAATLEFLSLGSLYGIPQESISCPQYPRLQHLYMQWVGVVAPNTVKRLLSSPLRGLALLRLDRSTHLPILLKASPQDSLRFLIMGMLATNDSDYTTLHTFLSRYSDLQKLSVRKSLSPTLDLHVIPSLTSGRFKLLTSLSLEWWDPFVPQDTFHYGICEKSLAALGSISSLRQLRIMCADFTWQPSQWLINHDVIRKHLSPLVNLRKLALCRDTYFIECRRNPGHEHEDDPREYYMERTLPRRARRLVRERSELDEKLGYFTDIAHRKRALFEQFLDYERNYQPLPLSFAEPVAPEGSLNDYPHLSHSEIWELVHRNRMLREVESYSSVFPRLVWMYVGQLSIGVVQPGAGHFGNAIPLISERDPCEKLLNEIFELEPDTQYL